jgi:hypothetical protein
MVLDPIFPSPDLSTNRKQFVNEIPQEIKYSLIFDEETDGPEVRQLLDAYYQQNIDEEDEESRDENSNKETGCTSSGVTANQNRTGFIKQTKRDEIESDKEEDLSDGD